MEHTSDLYWLKSNAGRPGTLTVFEARNQILIDVDSRAYGGRTPLSWAAGGGKEAKVEQLVKVVNLLMNAGAKADHRELWSRTPLSWAAQNGRLEVVKLLVQLKEVRADSTYGQRSKPLHHAAPAGQLAVVELLVNLDDVGRTQRMKMVGRHCRGRQREIWRQMCSSCSMLSICWSIAET